MLVLIRRIKGNAANDGYWEDRDEYDYEEDEDYLEDNSKSETVATTKLEEVPQPVVETKTTDSESKDDLRVRLTEEAKRTGVMQAAPGTEQGKTGWYIDSSGELTSWLVTESGEWTRMS